MGSKLRVKHTILGQISLMTEFSMNKEDKGT